MADDPLKGQRRALRREVRKWAASIVDSTCGCADNPLENDAKSKEWNDAAWELVCDEMGRIADRIYPEHTDD